MQKSLFSILIFLAPLFILANGFIIKGNIEGLQTGTVTLAYQNQAGEDTSLTARVTGGKFTFSGKIPEPELAKLTITEGWPYSINLFIENTTISVQLVKNNPEKSLITGSASNTTYQQLKPGLNDFFANARQNTAAHQQALIEHNSYSLKTDDSLWAAQQYQFIQSIRSAIMHNPENYAALYFIQWLLFKPDNPDTILSVYNQLGTGVRNSAAGKKFFADFEHLHKISIGAVAPEIKGHDTSGLPVKLSSYRGKIVLLDFWASYCGPCRQENRRMLSAYKKYHNEGFEIVSFSLDNERSMWVNAIQADGMPWPQASDLRGGAAATAGVYEITDLPRNILIDSTGKIYAKDIHGEDLARAIENLLTKRK